MNMQEFKVGDQVRYMLNREIFIVKSVVADRAVIRKDCRDGSAFEYEVPFRDLTKFQAPIEPSLVSSPSNLVPFLAEPGLKFTPLREPDVYFCSLQPNIQQLTREQLDDIERRLKERLPAGSHVIVAEHGISLERLTPGRVPMIAIRDDLFVRADAVKMVQLGAGPGLYVLVVVYEVNGQTQSTTISCTNQEMQKSVCADLVKRINDAAHGKPVLVDDGLGRFYALPTSTRWPTPAAGAKPAPSKPVASALAEFVAGSKALAEYERLTLALHNLEKEGRGDSAEADEIRQQMNAPWEAMTNEERIEANEYADGLRRNLIGCHDTFTDADGSPLPTHVPDIGDRGYKKSN